MTAADAGATRQLTSDVLQERIALLFEQLPFALVSNFIISFGLVALLWRSGQRETLIGWLTAVAALALARWVLVRSFRYRSPGSTDLMHWTRLYTVTVLLSGGLMGLAGILFFQDDLFTLFSLASVLSIMTIGSVMLHAAYTPSHMAYVMPVILPFALRCLLNGELIYITVGVTVLLFLPVNLVLYRKIQHGLIESIRLRLHNQVLNEELTRQKELAESAKAMAEQANVDKTRFFASASHDLRQPVQALDLFAAALDHELQGHRSHSLVGKIRTAGRELSDLLNALLDFSKIDAAGVQPVVRDFPLAPMLQRMADDFVPQAAASGLRCRVHGSSAWLRSDPVLLERIMRNFMNNALKYTPKGKILLGCRRVGSCLRIEVHDTGIGIPQHLQGEVFREFVQIDNPERDRQKGLGLGLAIVENLAGVLGHPLSLRSTPARGSLFAVTVPLGVPGDEPAEETNSAWGEVRSTAGALVVLVDDDQAIREAASQLLGNWGYAVLVAESSTQALDLLQASGAQPDVILADYRLREGRTGVEVIQAIQAQYRRDVPAAIITGDINPEHLATARRSGFPLLSKPLSAAKLRALLFNLLRA